MMTEAQREKVNSLVQRIERQGTYVLDVDVKMNVRGLPDGFASVVIRLVGVDLVYGISPEGVSHT